MISMRAASCERVPGCGGGDGNFLSVSPSSLYAAALDASQRHCSFAKVHPSERYYLRCYGVLVGRLDLRT